MRISDWSSDVCSSDLFGGQRLCIVLRGVEHHLHDAFDVAVGFDQAAEVHAETAGDGGAHQLPVEHPALDLAGFDNVLGLGLTPGLLTQREADRFHSTDTPALPVTPRCERLGALQLHPTSYGHTR